MLVLVYSICYVCLRTFVGHVLLLIAYTTWSIRHFWDFKFQTLTMQTNFKSGLFWARPPCNFVTNGLTRTVYQNIKIQGLLQNMTKHEECKAAIYIYNHWESLNEYSNIFEYQFPAPATALFLQPRVSSILRSSQSNKVPTCSNKHAGPKAAVVYECNLRKQSLAPTVLQSQKSTAHHKTTELDHRLEVMTKNTLMTGEIHPRPA